MIFPAGVVASLILQPPPAPFGLALYEELRKQPGNAVFSPYGVSAVLASAYAGARGNTARQMGDVLGFRDAKEALGAIRRIEAELERSAGVEGVAVATANAAFLEKSFRLREELVEELSSSLRLVDFAGDSEGARTEINRWVEAETRNEIQVLLPPGVVDSLTRLVLANAIFFEGRWSLEFPREETKEGPFWTSSSASRPVPLMRRKGTFPYAESPLARAVDIPYAGDGFSLLVLLPGERDGIGDLERSLSIDGLLELVRALEPAEVELFLPRFRIESRWDLVEPLESLGLTDVFSDAADFSGMSEKEDLHVGAVVHQGVVEVSEEGTRAAAGTAATIQSRSLAPPTPVKEFRCDHPFLFFIREHRSGALLFMGRVAEP